MTLEKYKASMEEHIVNDKEIDRKELNKVERKLDDHSKSVVRMFKVAENHNSLREH